MKLYFKSYSKFLAVKKFMLKYIQNWVWSGGEIFGKKIKTLWGGGAHKAPTPIITKVYLPLIITKVKENSIAITYLIC